MGNLWKKGLPSPTLIGTQSLLHKIGKHVKGKFLHHSELFSCLANYFNLFYLGASIGFFSCLIVFGLGFLIIYSLI
jgi:hypothetical protein